MIDRDFLIWVTHRDFPTGVFSENLQHLNVGVNIAIFLIFANEKKWKFRRLNDFPHAKTP